MPRKRRVGAEAYTEEEIEQIASQFARDPESLYHLGEDIAWERFIREKLRSERRVTVTVEQLKLFERVRETSMRMIGTRVEYYPVRPYIRYRDIETGRFIAVEEARRRYEVIRR